MRYYWSQQSVSLTDADVLRENRSVAERRRTPTEICPSGIRTLSASRFGVVTAPSSRAHERGILDDVVRCVIYTTKC